MAYTQLFIDYLHGKDPYTLKYFDECGVKLPGNGARNYGHAPIGERAVKVRRYSQTANITVNLICGLTGVTYMNTVNGPSNTLEFLRFFEEAYNSTNPNTPRPCLEVGDIVVMDNCLFHQNEGGQVLRDFLDDLNIELVYMPCYSPDFNPTEYVFGKLKNTLEVWALGLDKHQPDRFSICSHKPCNSWGHAGIFLNNWLHYSMICIQCYMRCNNKYVEL